MAEENIIQDIKERLVRIETLLENNADNNIAQQKNTEERFNDKLTVANKRIKDLEENQKWTWRTIVGALIIGAIGLLYKLK